MNVLNFEGQLATSKQVLKKSRTEYIWLRGKCTTSVKYIGQEGITTRKQKDDLFIYLFIIK